jgi:FkbM family methyltransferase
MYPSRLKHAVARYLSQHYPVAWTQYYRTFRKHHFEPEYWLIPLFCRPDKISVDVGANMGIYAFAMQRYSREVVAFEPNTDLWPFLRRFLGKKVRLEDAALSSGPGQAELRVVADNTGVATIEARNPLSMIDRPDTIATRSVITRTLDSFAFSDISFIKIDVEGHEEAVLAGARQTIAANRPVVLIESEDRHNPGAPAAAGRDAGAGGCKSGRAGWRGLYQQLHLYSARGWRADREGSEGCGGIALFASAGLCHSHISHQSAQRRLPP